MKINKGIFVVALSALALASCNLDNSLWGAGDVITETRPLKDFHALDIRTSGEVDVRVGNSFFVEVSAEENVIPHLSTRVENGTLVVSFNRSVFDADDVRIRVTAPSWDNFRLSGSADVDVVDAIKGNQLEVRSSGSGDLKVFNLDFDRIRTQQSGSGKVTLLGAADELNASLSGSGDLNALDCPVDLVTVSLSGSGDARVFAQKRLDATISGSGSVEYRGNAQVNSTISGSGRVRKL